MATMTSMNISLPEKLKKYVEKQVEHRGYSSTSEYFRELVRQDAKVLRATPELERLLLEGINSGPSEPWTKEESLRIRDEALKFIAQRKKQQGKQHASTNHT